MKLYDSKGWLDFRHIDEVADRNNISFVVIIGKRQIGKTYGMLKFMLDTNKRFILLRGMRTELEMLERNVNSPFEKIKGYEGQIFFQRDSDYTASIYRISPEDPDDKVYIAMGAALSNIGRIRGFNGDMFTDVVYDEFIPESSLLKVRHGGDAFLNMYTTVAGNRELEGRKPLRVWLLANSNNLDSDILAALELTREVEKMSIKGSEFRMIPKRGIMLIMPDSQQIIDQRKNSALYRAINPDSSFAKMAYGNEFAFNDFTDVITLPLSEYKPIMAIDGMIVHLHKNNKTLYITEAYGRYPGRLKRVYDDSDYSRRKLQRDYPELKASFLRGKTFFQHMKVKNDYLRYIDML